MTSAVVSDEVLLFSEKEIQYGTLKQQAVSKQVQKLRNFRKVSEDLL